MSKKIEDPKTEAKKIEDPKTEVKKNGKTENKKEPMQSMGLLSGFVKARKDALKKEHGGKRPISAHARKSRASKALIGAMVTRSWKDEGKGIYTLKGVLVDTNTQDFSVKVQDGIKEYKLELGQGAIIELDQFMAFR